LTRILREKAPSRCIMAGDKIDLSVAVLAAKNFRPEGHGSGQ
jgi:hypothetical protein